MPDRLTSRAVLAVLLLLLTIAGIRAAGPAVTFKTTSLPVVIGIGCTLEAVLAVLLIALRWRPRVTAGPVARLRMLLTGAIVTALIAIPAAMLIAAFAHIHPRRPLRSHPVKPGGSPTRLPLGRQDHGVIGTDIVRYVLIGLLIAAVIIAAILIWRRRGRWLRSAASALVEDDDTDTPAELARAVDSGRIALRELDDARAAIIGCYVAMEASLAEAGAARGAAETPDELLDRAVGASMVDAAPAGRLTALFYEARFSTHPMPPVRRDEAERALADISASLTPPDEALLAAGNGETPATAAPGEGR
ncbi:MAG: DUF4129 domain-containing protein [Nocardiopsaceae bacterium]|nr:DUF4129 domain-containing protein [Nocardiopsaceae bacterium]